MSTTWKASLWSDIRRLSDVIEVRSGETPRLRDGDRREVAILFLDLKDFTTISEEMDPETVYDLVTSVMKTLSDVVEAYGGYVDKIQGDSIMALFGARRAEENDSIRAVTCAVKMLDTIVDVNGILSDVDVSIDARVGITYGTVTVAPDPSGHLTAIGDEVNLASRLEATAEINTIQVSSQVRRQCGDVFEWKDLGEREVRGRKKPVHVYRPLGPGSVQHARWERASRVARSPLVGRDAEMERLRGVWHRQTSGEVGKNRLGGSRQLAIFLSGEAGIGKSRLMHEFLTEVRASSGRMNLLQGQTLSYAQQPFWLWITLIRSHFGLAMGDQNAGVRLDIVLKDLVHSSGNTALLDSRPFIASLLSIPVDDPSFEALDRESRHRETIMAIRSLIEAIAGSCRTVILLEDLHWIDSASREALDFVLRNCSTAEPVLFFCLYRPVWDTGTPIEEEQYADSVEVFDMRLAPVPEKGCRELIRHMLESGYPEEVEEFLLKRSGGNPFFLEELVLDLIEAGVLEEIEGTWQFTAPSDEVYIPSTLNSLIRSRIDRLQPEYRGGLQHCSVLGMDFLMKLYRRLHEKLMGSGEPEDIISELTRRDFLRTAGDSQEIKFIFRHFLIHDSAYDTLLHRNRRILHRYAAESIEELFSEESEDLASLIAHHWERAGNRQQAMKWGLKALTTCRRNFQNEEGLLWADKLAAWFSEEEGEEALDVLIDILRRKQDILGLLGRRDEQQEVIDRLGELAEGSGCDRHRALVHMLQGSCRSIDGLNEEAQADFEKALALTPERERAQIYSVQGDNYFRQSRYPEALECDGKVLELTDDYVLKTRTELSIAFIYSIMGRRDKVEEHLAEAWKLLEENAGTGPSIQRARYFARYAGFLHDGGESEKALEYYNRALEIFRKCGDLSGESMVLNNMHSIYYTIGDYGKSLDTILESVRIDSQTGDRLATAIAYYNTALTYQQMKDSDSAREYFDRYLDLSVRISNELGIGYGNFGLAGLFEEEGDTDSAIAYYRKAIEVFDALGSMAMAFETRLKLASVYAGCGRPGEARELLDWLAGHGLESGEESSISYLRGLICIAEASGRREELEKAAGYICDSLGKPGDLTRTDVAARNVKLAGLLRELGRDEECGSALGRGSKALGVMMKDVDPRFVSDVIEYENLSGFLSLCESAGCAVELPSRED
jgi:class 3 adenylate cyclase/tetratricopeptide (TPR) repeat protein